MSLSASSKPLVVFVPKEIKAQEHRVGLTPSGALELVQAQGTVLIETGAGLGSGFSDEDYVRNGAEIVSDAAAGYRRGELVVKVKEPLQPEWPLLRPGQLLFTYLHLAASRELTEAVLASGATALAYETLTDERGRLPLLTPMSEVAGRLAVQEGARHLLAPTGGRGVLLGGVSGTRAGVVLIIGAGVVGTEAARMAAGLGAEVVLLDRDLDRLREVGLLLPANVRPLFSDAATLGQELSRADLVIGAVLLRGARAPRLISRADLGTMPRGSVLVDVSVDQGGIAETTRATSHELPTYVVDGVVHYCVPNIPGAVPRTSTVALTNATLPFVVRLAMFGLERAIALDARLVSALNAHRGHLTEPAVAAAFGIPYLAPPEALAASKASLAS